MKKVLLDIDGVICDFVGSAVKSHLAIYPNDQIKPIDTWYIDRCFIHSAEFRNLAFYKEDTRREVLKNCKPYDGVLEQYNKLCQDFEVDICTKRKDIEVTLEWLSKYKFNKHKEVIFTKNKGEVAGDILIDDNIDYLYEFENTGRLAICIDRAWNVDYEGYRVRSINEAMEIIHNIKKLQDITQKINKRNQKDHSNE